MVVHSLPPLTTVLEDGSIYPFNAGFTYVTVGFSEGVHLLGDIPEPTTAYMTVKMLGSFLGVSTFTEATFQAQGYSGLVQVHPVVIDLPTGEAYHSQFFSYSYYNNDCPYVDLNPNEVCYNGPIISDTIVIPFTISNGTRDFTVRNTLSFRAALGAAVNFSHTASMGLILPPGVTFTSDSGIFLTQPADDQSFTTPIANAGVDQTVNEGDPVTLNGSGSTDPLNLPLIFTWTQVAGLPVTLNLSDPVHPTFTAPAIMQDTVLTFQLVVNDGALDSSPDTVDVRIIAKQQLPGDLSGDDKVDCADLAIVKASFGKRSGQPGFDPRADTNGDNIVNVRDLAFVSQKLPVGTKCP